MKTVMDKLSMALIKGSILNGYMLKAAKQINMRLSLMEYFSEGGDSMADFSVELREKLKKKLVSKEYVGLENDREYYFAVGQMAGYFIYLSKAAKKPQSMINPFLNAKSDEALKKKLGQYYKKYNYDMLIAAKKVNRLYGMIKGYTPDENVVMEDMISVGFVVDNLLLEKKEEGKDE